MFEGELSIPNHSLLFQTTCPRTWDNSPSLNQGCPVSWASCLTPFGLPACLHDHLLTWYDNEDLWPEPSEHVWQTSCECTSKRLLLMRGEGVCDHSTVLCQVAKFESHVDEPSVFLGNSRNGDRVLKMKLNESSCEKYWQRVWNFDTD